ncbi:patatin-like phospholipase family protein [Pseudodesulfovibrio tunisiensis]|uniref:patatin-like phospholipase family protein n=1 Tax=Pseudodesulfovibrio tunisiensis TaxID=463192 RepID=UPI001FB3A489|nr:patatin-like phospholipase family protein [Pseudodesulfovibrio tunisiensis]
MTKIGLALGAGGARGLAHLVMLEALDQAGIRPHAIAGASIGAIMGALYAAGNSGADLRRGVDDLVGPLSGSIKDAIKDAFTGNRLKQIISLIDPSFGKSGMLSGDRFMDMLEEMIGVRTFEALQIPLKVVASEFWSREEIVLDSGPLRPAIRASMALPGVFTPVTQGSRVLIDGGAVNPLPYDLLQDECDAVIAIDLISSGPGRRNGEVPDLFETIFSTFQIMEKSIIRQKLEHRPPDIYIEMDIRGVKSLEFHKTREIYKQAAAAREQLFRELERTGLAD